MPNREIHELNIRDFTYVMANLRDDDVDEIAALLPTNIQRADYAVFLSQAAFEGPAYSVYVHDEPVAVFGAQPGTPYSTAIGWAFGTNMFKRAAAAISHFYWNKIGHDLHGAGVLRLEVRAMSSKSYARNWLKKCGFHEDCELKYFGTSGQSFHLYSITLDDYNKKFSGRLN